MVQGGLECGDHGEGLQEQLAERVGPVAGLARLAEIATPLGQKSPTAVWPYRASGSRKLRFQMEMSRKVNLLLGRRLIDASEKFSYWLADLELRGTAKKLVRVTDEFLEHDRILDRKVRWNASDSWGRPVASAPPIPGNSVLISGMDLNGRELMLPNGHVKRVPLRTGYMEGINGVSYAASRGVAAFFERTRWGEKPLNYAHTFFLKNNRIKWDGVGTVPPWPSSQDPIIIHFDVDPGTAKALVNADIPHFDTYGHDLSRGTVISVEPEMLAKLVANDTDIRKLADSDSNRPIVALAGYAGKPDSLFAPRFADALQNVEGFRHDLYLSRGAQLIREGDGGFLNVDVEATRKATQLLGRPHHESTSIWETYPASSG
ncbi:hypothetical protein IU459_35535 [Nocardia amamiensis]|uniref:Phage portal protein n=1 Tax=Nocardia amamiensis TaxID=404578 RepID=A0ABS0D3X1_9NOCA|nr:hypothetical protein [Nocardia amamiensis]MBF6302808.1 hypothetical protein [Nocardia amamiensis]